MKIRDSVALVTGANRGIGAVFVQELLAAAPAGSMRPLEVRSASSSMECAGGSGCDQARVHRRGRQEVHGC